jgi:hypothetical protein
MKNLIRNTPIVCPGCNKHFHPIHGNQIFCNYKCYERDYNQNHRDKSKNYLATLKANIELLQSIMKYNKQSIVTVSELELKGFDFMIYTERHSSSEDKNIFYIVYGEFITNLTQNESIFIKNK